MLTGFKHEKIDQVMNLREIRGQIDSLKRNVNPFNPNEHHILIGNKQEQGAKTCRKVHRLEMNYKVNENKTRGFKEMVKLSDRLIRKKKVEER